MMPNSGKVCLSRSDNPNGCVIHESGSDVCLVSSDCVFFSWPLACLVVVCEKLHLGCQTIETERNRAFSAMFSINQLRSWVMFNICCSYRCQMLKISVASLIFVSSVDLDFPKYSSLWRNSVWQLLAIIQSYHTGA